MAAKESEQVEHNGASLTVPEKSYYVLGDNAERSLDSRYWEDPFVRDEEIVA
ncbi:S26 family signal peptidase [Extibacter muris]|uniref:S26 family signal peptidase n=1 Tax=Extibacter muris TaxID=1796622 RepID=UPI002FE62F68